MVSTTVCTIDQQGTLTDPPLTRPPCRWGLGPMAQKKKQLVAEGKLDKHGRPNENTPKEYLRSLPDVAAAKVRP